MLQQRRPLLECNFVSEFTGVYHDAYLTGERHRYQFRASIPALGLLSMMTTTPLPAAAAIELENVCLAEAREDSGSVHGEPSLHTICPSLALLVDRMLRGITAASVESDSVQANCHMSSLDAHRRRI